MCGNSELPRRNAARTAVPWTASRRDAVPAFVVYLSLGCGCQGFRDSEVVRSGLGGIFSHACLGELRIGTTVEGPWKGGFVRYDSGPGVGRRWTGFLARDWPGK